MNGSDFLILPGWELINFTLPEVNWSNSSDPERDAWEQWSSLMQDRAVVVSLLLLFSMTTVFGNMLVILAVVRERYLHTATNYFITSLAVADCLVGLVVMPFSALYEVLEHTWFFGTDWCDIWRSLDVLFSTASILNLCVISLDRYWAITDPITYPMRMTRIRSALLIAAVWVCSSAISFPAIVWWRAVRTEPIPPYKCPFTEHLGYLIFSSTISFYLPLFVMVFTYYRIYRAAVAQTRSLRLGTKQVLLGSGELELTLRIHRGGTCKIPETRHLYSTQEDEPLTALQNNGLSRMASTRLGPHHKNFSLSRKLAKFAKEKKAAKTLGIVMGVFIVCWLPFFVVNLLSGFCLQCIWHEEIVLAVVTWLGWINSSMNPVIYACWSRDFRSSFRDGCPSLIKVRVTKDGSKLFIKDLILKHNHENSQAIYNHLPRQRRLDTSAREMAKKMVKLKVNKKLLQNDIISSTGKIITLKDIHNLASTSKDELQEIVARYKECRDVTLKFVQNEEGTLKAIYYQDKEMQRVFSFYPELLFIDAIYKVNDRRMPLYVFLIEDGNGQSEIVAFCLLTSEDSQNVLTMAKIFKEFNPDWHKVTTVMADKDFTERLVFKSEFPDAKILICIFHCMRSLSREVTTEKRNISKSQKDMCLRIFQKMVFSRSETEYIQHYEDLKATNLTNVLNYFDKNWHPIRNEWVTCFQEQGLTFGNRTNNRLESINQKITQVVSRFARIDQLFEGLDNLLITLRTERDQVAAYVFCKKNCNIKNLEEDAIKYNEYLTPYSFNLILNQIRQKEKVNCLDIDKELFSAKIVSSAGDLRVTRNNCQCSFFTSFSLPCRHILKLRETLQTSIFCEDLCALRWTKDYYRRYCRVIPSEHADTNNVSNDDNQKVLDNIDTRTVPIVKKKVLSYQERFRISKVITDEMASILAEATGEEFTQRKSELMALKKKWLDNDNRNIPELNVLSEETDDVINNEQQINLLERNDDVNSDEMALAEQIINAEIIFSEEIVVANNNFLETQTEENTTEEENLGQGDLQQSASISEKYETNNNVSEANSEEIKKHNLPKLPQKIRKRGRPKGAALCVIKLKKKK